MNQAYDSAVIWVRSEFENDFPERPLEFAEIEPSYFALRRILKLDREEIELGYDPAILPFLLKYAEENRGAFDLVCEIIARHLDSDVALPKEMKEWIVDTLSGIRSRPKKTRASKTFSRNLMLIGLVCECSERFGLRRTRNDATEARSSCDAVSEGLGLAGYYISERALKDLLTHQSAEDVRAIAELFRHDDYDIEWDMTDMPDLPIPPT